LRVYSPSAEVKGHGGEGVLQVGKEHVQIIDIQPVGNYCIKLVFDDGHDTGLYMRALLYELGRDKETKWQAYLARLAAAGMRMLGPEEPVARTGEDGDIIIGIPHKSMDIGPGIFATVGGHESAAFTKIGA
jgi:DUF971 family protein